MNQFAYKNRWIAIAFATLILGSAIVLVGTEGRQGPVSQAQEDRLTGENGNGGNEPGSTLPLEPGSSVSPISVPFDSEPSDVEFMDDDDLIDEALGTEPVPEFPDGFVQADLIADDVDIETNDTDE